MDVETFIEQWRGPEDFIVAHTSGSTGTPKEVRLLKRDMELSARATCRFFGIGPGSVLFLPLSVDYIAGKMQVVRAQVSGARLVAVCPTRDFASLGPFPKIDMAPLVPAQIEGYIASPLAAATRHVIVGGAPMSRAQEQRLVEWDGDAWATYGMTETASHVALRRVGEECYKALPGYDFSLDGRGCLVVENPEMSWGRLVTNDVADLADSHIFILRGRYDDVIITGGVKVHPAEAEKALAPIMGGRGFYVSSRESAEWGREVVLVLTDGEPADEPELLRRCATALPRHHAPKAVVRDLHPLKTATGKLKRKKFPIKNG